MFLYDSGDMAMNGTFMILYDSSLTRSNPSFNMSTIMPYEQNIHLERLQNYIFCPESSSGTVHLFSIN